MQGFHKLSSGNAISKTLYDANPYRNQTYNKSPWQNFLTSLGFRTEADAWQENMAVQAAEYDAAIAQKMYDQNYNDPTNQVARMRAAGLNPDLDGGSSISSGDPGSPAEDPSTPMQSTGDDAQIMNFANGVLGAFSTALGLVQSVQGVARNHIQNDLLSVQTESSASDYARNLATQLIPTTPDDLFDDDGQMVGDWKMNAVQGAKMFVRNFPKRMQKKMLNEIEHFWNTAPTSRQAFEEWTNKVKSEKAYAFESQYFYDEVKDVLKDIWKPIAEMQENIYSARQNADFEGASADLEENMNRATYAHELDPSTAADAQNRINSANGAQADIQKSLRTAMSRIMKNLEHRASEGGFTGTMSQFMLVLLAMQQMQMLPSLNTFVGMFK